MSWRILIWTIAWGLAIWLALQGGANTHLWSGAVIIPLVVLAIIGLGQDK